MDDKGCLSLKSTGLKTCGYFCDISGKQLLIHLKRDVFSVKGPQRDSGLVAGRGSVTVNKPTLQEGMDKHM